MCRPSAFARNFLASVAVVLLIMLNGITSAGAIATPTSPTRPTGLPPAAPRATSGANSPGAPDPHPPAGGIGPVGESVGGARLRSRGLVTPKNAPAVPAAVNGAAWALVDLDSGNVLAARDPHGRYQPASILKILTVDTLLPKLPGNRVVTVSAAAAGTEGSHAGLVAGGRYTVDQLFSGLLLVSGNDTAMALAEAAGGVKQTVAAMNAKALALGAYDTYVETPSGLDGWRQLTSAYDMALFLKSALDSPRFVAYDRQASAVLPAQHIAGDGFGAVTLANQSQLFLTQVPGGLVAKTGFTDAAQHTYLAAAERGGRRLGVVFLRAQRWPVDQWQQAAALFNWGFALAKGTAAVGHLDAAYVSSAAGASAAAKASATAVAARVLAASKTSKTTFSPGRIAIGTLATLGVLALVSGLATAAASVRNRRGSKRPVSSGRSRR
jgi:D-alanyl-D-alanine carboxypeptidase (penicillin-binding protein 5/6)